MLYLLLVAGVALIGGAVVAIERLTRQPAGMKRLLDAPLTTIAEVADATDVRIEGTVEAFDGTEKAPVSGDRCVYYEHVAREGNPIGGLPSIAARIMHQAVNGLPFVVRDATGYAIVDPHGATALLQVHHRAEQGEPRHFFERLDPTSSNRTGLKHTEYVIRPGDRLVVIGRAVREPDPDPTTAGGTYRDGPATRLRFTHSPQFPLHLIDPARKT